jgi:hypothetical protein
MIEVQGKSVRLYLEGLMFFALNEEQNRLEAGILNVDDQHNMRVRAFSRRSTKKTTYPEGVWRRVKAESIPDTELRSYEQGEIAILCAGGESKNITSTTMPANREMWMPFNLIPEFEDIVGSEVTLDRSKVKPVLSITGGNFYSVLRPDHVEDAKPIERRVDTRGFIQTYRLEKDQVLTEKNNSHRHTESVHDLADLVAAAKDLAIRAYTAATIITLNKGEELVCVLKNQQGEQRMLFRVKYAPNREAKVVLENAVTQHDDGSHLHSHSGGGTSSDVHGFHFLHFYEAIKEINEKKQFLLANEEMLAEFLNNEVETESNGDIESVNPTGGADPECPAVLMPRGLFTD